MNYDKGNNKEVSVLYNNAAHPKWNILLNNFKWINSRTCEWVWRLITPKAELWENWKPVRYFPPEDNCGSITHFASKPEKSYFFFSFLMPSCDITEPFIAAKSKEKYTISTEDVQKFTPVSFSKAKTFVWELSLLKFQCERKLTFITNLLIETEAY